jgi:hypothetical protein
MVESWLAILSLILDNRVVGQLSRTFHFSAFELRNFTHKTDKIGRAFMWDVVPGWNDFVGPNPLYFFATISFVSVNLNGGVFVCIFSESIDHILTFFCKVHLEL